MNRVKHKLLHFLRDGKKGEKYLLRTSVKFDAAHRLSYYEGKCNRLHGHTWKIVVIVKSNKLNNWGAVVDFGELKKIIKQYVNNRYDHKTILYTGDNENKVLARVMGKDWVSWMNSNPTAENMARDIYQDLELSFKKFKDVKLVSITVFETKTNAATYEF